MCKVVFGESAEFIFMFLCSLEVALVIATGHIRGEPLRPENSKTLCLIRRLVCYSNQYHE